MSGVPGDCLAASFHPSAHVDPTEFSAYGVSVTNGKREWLTKLSASAFAPDRRCFLANMQIIIGVPPVELAADPYIVCVSARLRAATP
jgi:hypothetical protein